MERVCKKLDISFEFACGGFFEADISYLYILVLHTLYLNPECLVNIPKYQLVSRGGEGVEEGWISVLNLHVFSRRIYPSFTYLTSCIAFERCLFCQYTKLLINQEEGEE